MQWLIELQIALPFEFCDIYASILSSYLVHLFCAVTNKCHVFLFWEKKVRTKDHIFDSINHLIGHHRDNSLPIVSAGSELCLKQPVGRK